LKQKTGKIEAKPTKTERNTNPAKIHDAIIFAAVKYHGLSEPATGIEYICHALEVMDVLTSMGADDDVKIAGILQGIPDITGTPLFDIAQRYGKGVAELVDFAIEGRDITWKQRTEAAVAKLNFADKRAQMMLLADKVVTQRSIVAGIRATGDEVWSRMKATKAEVCSYLSEVQDAMKELQNYDETSDIYWEMVTTFKDIFVEFWTNEDMDRIYQVASAGSYVLHKEEPKWVDFDGPLPEGLVKIHRKQSEQMEAEWLTFYIIHIESRDMKDAMYEIYEGSVSGKRRKDAKNSEIGNTRKLTVSISGRKIQFNCHDDSIYIDENGEEHEHRFYYELARKESSVFAKLLRSQYGAGADFETILKDAFGYYDGPLKFKAFCEAFNLGYVFCTDKH